MWSSVHLCASAEIEVKGDVSSTFLRVYREFFCAALWVFGADIKSFTPTAQWVRCSSRAAFSGAESSPTEIS